MTKQLEEEIKLENFFENLYDKLGKDLERMGFDLNLVSHAYGHETEINASFGGVKVKLVADTSKGCYRKNDALDFKGLCKVFVSTCEEILKVCEEN